MNLMARIQTFFVYQIQFPREYILTYVRFMQRLDSDEQFKDIELQFDASPRVQVYFQRSQGNAFAILHFVTVL